MGRRQAGEGLEEEDDPGTLTVGELGFFLVFFFNVLFQHWLSTKSRMLIFCVFKIGFFTLLDKKSLYIGSHSKRETKKE